MPSKHKALIDSVRIEQISDATCAFFIGARRVGFIGLGAPGPVSWLPEKVVKMPLELGQRKAVVDRLRELVAKKTSEVDKERAELLAAEAGVSGQEASAEEPADK